MHHCFLVQSQAAGPSDESKRGGAAVGGGPWPKGAVPKRAAAVAGGLAEAAGAALDSCASSNRILKIAMIRNMNGPSTRPELVIYDIHHLRILDQIKTS